MFKDSQLSTAPIIQIIIPLLTYAFYPKHLIDSPILECFAHWCQFPVYGMALAQISNNTTASQKQFVHLTLALASGKLPRPGELGHI